MKVLFLDIDGVCNSRRFAEAGNSLWNNTDPEAVKLVRRIIDQTKCKVVLSSTWRLYPDSCKAVKEQVCDYIDVTPRHGTTKDRYGVQRGYEVQEWLDKHPEVTQYAILDDDADFMPDQHLFKTTFNDGITPEITEAVIAHLNA